MLMQALDIQTDGWRHLWVDRLPPQGAKSNELLLIMRVDHTGLGDILAEYHISTHQPGNYQPVIDAYFCFVLDSCLESKPDREDPKCQKHCAGSNNLRRRSIQEPWTVIRLHRACIHNFGAVLSLLDEGIYWRTRWEWSGLRKYYAKGENLI